MTEYLSTDSASLQHAAEILRAGGLVAFPTETVYGLGARADDSRAVRRIFEAKGRPLGNPLIVHVPDSSHAYQLAQDWPPEAVVLSQAFWPGPLTLIVKRSPRIVDEVTAAGPTVALRVPAHPVALALLQAANVPVAAPSANRSSEVSPTTAAHVAKSLDGRIDAIVDAGPTTWGIESTIVDVTVSPARVLRLGALALDVIRQKVPLAIYAHSVIEVGQQAPAPGSYARHYAPRAAVRLVSPDDVKQEVTRAVQMGLRVGSIEVGHATVVGACAHILPSDPVGYAAMLYAVLHKLEDAACDIVVVATVPSGSNWDAIRDRLTRAAALA